MQKLYSILKPGSCIFLVLITLLQACSSTSNETENSLLPDQEDSTDLAPMQSLDSDSVSYNPYEAVPQENEAAED
jgi:hypothetical protein